MATFEGLILRHFLRQGNYLVEDSHAMVVYGSHSRAGLLCRENTFELLHDGIPRIASSHHDPWFLHLVRYMYRVVQHLGRRLSRVSADSILIQPTSNGPGSHYALCYRSIICRQMLPSHRAQRVGGTLSRGQLFDKSFVFNCLIKSILPMSNPTSRNA